MWIDPANAQKTWDNLRAAVVQQIKLRAAPNKDYSSWQEGGNRESRDWDVGRAAGDPKRRQEQDMYKNTQQAGTGSAQRDGYQADADSHPTPQGGHTSGHPTLRRSARA